MNKLVTPREAVATERNNASHNLSQCQLALEIAQHKGEGVNEALINLDLAETRVYRANLAKVLVSIMYQGVRRNVIGMAGKWGHDTVLTLEIDGQPVEVTGKELEKEKGFAEGFVFEAFETSAPVVPVIATVDAEAQKGEARIESLKAELLELDLRAAAYPQEWEQIKAKRDAVGAEMMKIRGLEPEPAKGNASYFILTYDEERGPNPLSSKPLIHSIDAAKRINRRGGFASVRDAVQWVLDRNLPTAWFYLAEYIDVDGEEEKIGACTLDEAEEAQYTSLDF